MILRCAIVVLAAWMGDGADAPTDGTTTSNEVGRDSTAPRVDARASVRTGLSPLDWDVDSLFSDEEILRAYDELPEAFQVSSAADVAGTLTTPQRDSLVATLANKTEDERLAFAGRLLFWIVRHGQPVLALRETAAILTGVFVDSLENGGETACEIAIVYLAVFNPAAINIEHDDDLLCFHVGPVVVQSGNSRIKLLKYINLASKGLAGLLRAVDPAGVNRTEVGLERARCVIGRCVGLIMACRHRDSIVVLAVIRRALSDPAVEVRAVGAALTGIVHCDFQRSAQKLINQALEDSDQDVRNVALATIAMSSLNTHPWSGLYSRARLIEPRKDLDRLRKDLATNAASTWPIHYLLALRTLGPDGAEAIPEVVKLCSALAARRATNGTFNEDDDLRRYEPGTDMDPGDFFMSRVIESNICCTALTLAEYGPEACAVLPQLSSLLKGLPVFKSSEARAAIAAALVGIDPTMYPSHQSVLREFCHEQLRASYESEFREDGNIVRRVAVRLLLDHAADVEEKRAILQEIVSKDIAGGESELFVQSRMEAAVELASLDERARRQLVDLLHVGWLEPSLPEEQLTEAEYEKAYVEKHRLKVQVNVGIAVARTLAQWKSYRPAAIELMLDVAHHSDKERGGFDAEKRSCDALWALAQIGPTDPSVRSEVAEMIEQALSEVDGESRVEAGCEVLCSAQGAAADLAPLLVKVIRHQRSLLKDSPAGFRDQPLSGAAVRALGIVGVSSPVAIQTLVDVVTDSTPLFQYEAALALRRLRVAQPEVVLALSKALGSEYREVRSAASKALARISPCDCPAQTRGVQARRKQAP